MAWIYIRMQGRVQPTIVVFAEPGSEPILGVVTLEEFRLAVDPVNRRLISVPGLLKRATSAIEQSRTESRGSARPLKAATARSHPPVSRAGPSREFHSRVAAES